MWLLFVVAAVVVAVAIFVAAVILRRLLLVTSDTKRILASVRLKLRRLKLRNSVSLKIKRQLKDKSDKGTKWNKSIRLFKNFIIYNSFEMIGIY